MHIRYSLCLIIHMLLASCNTIASKSEVDRALAGKTHGVIYAVVDGDTVSMKKSPMVMYSNEPAVVDTTGIFNRSTGDVIAVLPAGEYWKSRGGYFMVAGGEVTYLGYSRRGMGGIITETNLGTGEETRKRYFIKGEHRFRTEEDMARFRDRYSYEESELTVKEAVFMGEGPRRRALTPLEKANEDFDPALKRSEDYYRKATNKRTHVASAKTYWKSIVKALDLLEDISIHQGIPDQLKLARAHFLRGRAYFQLSSRTITSYELSRGIEFPKSKLPDRLGCLHQAEAHLTISLDLDNVNVTTLRVRAEVYGELGQHDLAAADLAAADLSRADLLESN